MVTTTSSARSDVQGHIESLRVEVSRTNSAIRNPIYQYGLVLSSEKAIEAMGEQLPSRGTVDSETGGSETSQQNSQVSDDRYLAPRRLRRTKRLLEHCSTWSEDFFGTIVPESNTKSLELQSTDDQAPLNDEVQYEYETSFRFHPTTWLMKLGFSYGLHVGIPNSSIQGWQHRLEISCPVPDQSLIFSCVKRVI
jgi:hypothetical protein